MASSMIERLLTAVYAREPHVKVVAAVTGGGVSVAESLFRPGSSSTMLHFAVPYSRASLQSFLSSVPSTSPSKLKFCSAETSERMALAAWKQANEITRQEAEEDDAQAAALLPSALKRFRASLGIACTAGLATNYSKKGPHECFLSVCQARGSTLLRPQCETYHLQLDKTLGRTRTEEDHIVSRWLVYLLAKAADVDTETCNAFREELLAAQTGSDALVKLTSDEEVASDSDPLLDICSGKSSHLMSVAFLPEHASGEVDAGTAAMTTTATRGFDFRGLILPGSFNPLHKGHVDLARAAQQVLKSQTGVELPVAFELAVSNADKGAIESATIATRVAQFSHDNTLGLGAWPVLVTNATLFGQKAELLPGCAFVIGADTAVRIVDKKYYDMDEHKMVLALDHIARKNCSFVVAGRFDNKVENRFISAEEVLDKSVPPVFRHLFVPLPESAFRNDISSTELRRQMARQHNEQRLNDIRKRK